MRITQRGRDWTIEVRTERHPVHDARFVDWMTEQWTRFFVNGFGVGTKVTCSTKLEAGSRQDGTPADQLVMIPPVCLDPDLKGVQL